jgi:hypothetical protein
MIALVRGRPAEKPNRLPIAVPASTVGGTAGATALAAMHGPGLLPMLVFLVPQLLAGLVAVEQILARRGLQQLHAEVVRAGVAKCDTPAELRELLGDLAATHPEHLGIRLKYRSGSL